MSMTGALAGAGASSDVLLPRRLICISYAKRATRPSTCAAGPSPRRSAPVAADPLPQALYSRLNTGSSPPWAGGSTVAGWHHNEFGTVLDLLEARLEADPDGPYLDVGGDAFSAAAVCE